MSNEKPYLKTIVCASALGASVLVVPPSAKAVTMTDILQEVDGKATLIAQDGKYLGTLSSSTQGKSICNPSSYGNPYGLDSIHNQNGFYGSIFGINSAWNPYSISPPVIVYGGKKLAYVTTNKNIPNNLKLPPIHPATLLSVYGCL